MQGLGHVAFKCRSTAAMTLSLCTNELSPILPMKRFSVLNRQFPFNNDLIKYVNNKKPEKHDFHTIFTTY